MYTVLAANGQSGCNLYVYWWLMDNGQSGFTLYYSSAIGTSVGHDGNDGRRYECVTVDDDGTVV